MTFLILIAVIFIAANLTYWKDVGTMGWTKADDEKLRLLDSYGVTVIDMSEILGVTYNFAKSRLEKIITDKKEE